MKDRLENVENTLGNVDNRHGNVEKDIGNGFSRMEAAIQRIVDLASSGSGEGNIRSNPVCSSTGPSQKFRIMMSLNKPDKSSEIRRTLVSKDWSPDPSKSILLPTYRPVQLSVSFRYIRANQLLHLSSDAPLSACVTGQFGYANNGYLWLINYFS